MFSIFRESVLSPLIVSGMLGLVDVEIKFSGTIGFTNEAFAARYGIAWGIASLVDEETVEKLRLAGLLTKEIKLPERKMYGKEGARRRYTWRKR
ncbi:hypothetical protein GJ496_009932 [Pomphorhynchus laevis]|nr:hypothetical protein GJ496_009932 [Pomphorhynchus laevis]